MNGERHIVTGLALAADAGLLAERAAAAFPDAGSYRRDSLSPLSVYGRGPAGWLVCAGCAGLYVFGSVLPDVDHGGVASKWLHFTLPVRHRGWTHALWSVFLFMGLSVFCPPLWILRWLAVGMLAHDLMDAPSDAGWAPFYPLGKWRVYHNTVIARKRPTGLYGSSKPGSEAVFAGVVVAVSAAWWGFWAYLSFFAA